MNELRQPQDFATTWHTIGDLYQHFDAALKASDASEPVSLNLTVSEGLIRLWMDALNQCGDLLNASRAPAQQRTE